MLLSFTTENNDIKLVDSKLPDKSDNLPDNLPDNLCQTLPKLCHSNTPQVSRVRVSIKRYN